VRANVRGAAATESVATVVAVPAAVSAIGAAVKAPNLSRTVTANVHDQHLSGCDRDNGAHTPAIDYGGTCSFRTPSIDLDLPQACRHRELLRSTRVIKRFMVREMVRASTVWHNAVTGVAAAARKGCQSHATQKREAA
jgi:hypothetical protein